MYYQEMETSSKFKWSHAWKKALDALQQTTVKNAFTVNSVCKSCVSLWRVKCPGKEAFLHCCFLLLFFSTGQANKTKGTGYFLCPPVLLFFSFVCFVTRITSLKMAECCLCPGFISQSKCPFPSRYNSHSSTVRFLQVNMSSLFSSTWIIASFHFMVHRGLMCEPVTKAFAGQCTVTCFRQTRSAGT